MSASLTFFGCMVKSAHLSKGCILLVCCNLLFFSLSYPCAFVALRVEWGCVYVCVVVVILCVCPLQKALQ